jgi:hypothetical protein
MEPTPTPPARPYRSESFWLAVIVSVIHLVLLGILAVVAWRSPYLLMRLPEIPPKPVPSAVSATLL